MTEQLCFICGVNPSYKDGMCKKCKGVFGSLENVPATMEQFYKEVDLIKQSDKGEPNTFDELCHREIVKIRELTLKDDKYTSHLLAEAVGSPIGITMCVEARMQQIADLQAENKRMVDALAQIRDFKLGEMSDADGYSVVCEIADKALAETAN